LDAPKTILVADDHEASLAGLEGLLSAEGFNVVTARDGQAALAEFRRAQPDLVLPDVKMPAMTGIEVCRIIKSNPETRLVPLILITGLTAIEDRVAGINAGADDFLNKPVDRLQLIARVRSLLRQKAHTDELERAESVLFTLALSIEGKDPYTEGHCQRLAEHSARLGEFLGLDTSQIIALRRAGLVHDIGKVAVPDAILLKAGRLTPGEVKIMQRHPVVGERICSPKIFSAGASHHPPSPRKDERHGLSRPAERGRNPADCPNSAGRGCVRRPYYFTSLQGGVGPGRGARRHEEGSKKGLVGSARVRRIRRPDPERHSQVRHPGPSRRGRRRLDNDESGARSAVHPGNLICRGSHTLA